MLNDSSNSVYCFLLEGNILVAGQELARRDALGIWNTTQFELKAIDESKVLLLEVPMYK